MKIFSFDKIFLALALTSSYLIATPLTDLSPHNEERARQEMLEQIAGEWVTHGIYAVTSLGIADYLDNGPLHYEELAHLSNTDSNSLYRLLRMLSSQGIFFENQDKSFSHTDKSKLLSTRNPYSLNALTKFYAGVIHKSWEGLLDGLRSGTPGFNMHFGIPVFQYFKQNPDDLSLFHQAIAEKSTVVIDSCLNNFDFGAFKTIYDVGGGKGHFLWKILELNKGSSGVLFELPEVIAEVQNEMNQFHPRSTFVAGDFFEQVPEGGELYILKSVIHDWDDSQAKTILSTCHKAMSDRSKLIIVEPILGERNTFDYAKLMDILMFNVTGGKERSFDHFTKLLKESNFTIEKVIPTSTEFKIIVAVKN